MLLSLLVSLLLSYSEAKLDTRTFGVQNSNISWESAEAQAVAFVAKLNLTEKATLVTGTELASGVQCIGNVAPIPRVNFSGVCFGDGPAGVNRNDRVSVFPAGLTAAATWDKQLIYRRGVAIGEEFRDKGIHVMLGPVAGPLGRHPLGGRNWEGFGADPYLNGQAMANTVAGIQSQGVQSVPKHFVGNEQETQRSSTISPNGTVVEGISANIDDRTLHEIYLWPFADAVRAGTVSIMCSYNRLNGTYACENSRLLNEILKGELGFRGYVQSDWFATHTGTKSIVSGLDLDMPGPINETDFGDTFFGQNVVRAVQNGSLSEQRLDDMVQRIMTAYFFLGQQQYPSVDPSEISVLSAIYGLSADVQLLQIPARDVRGDHATVIREMGAAGTVLLKNVNSTLPLKTPKEIGVFGNDASEPAYGMSTESYTSTQWGPEFGTLDIGGGSGTVRHTTIVSPLQAIQARASTYDARVQYVLDNKLVAANDFKTIYPIPDVCLVFLKTWASEGIDRLSFENDFNSTAVVTAVAARCPNTVVVTHSAGVNTLPWANNPNVTAILAAHYPGEQTGNSIVDVLWGDVNPSGKLPYTIPVKESDYGFPIVNITGPAQYDSSAWQEDFTEGQLIDYHHFDAYNITPLYEFGYGLSYTSFDLASSLSLALVDGVVAGNISSSPSPLAKIEPGGNTELWNPLVTATAKVTNTGHVQGSAVVQLYVSLPRGSTPNPELTPIKKLRGFEKVALQPNQTQDVQFNLTRRDLSWWDSARQGWRLPSGNITVNVGFSSRDLPLASSISLL